MTDPKLVGRERAFAALGRWIHKHPYHPIIAWVALLLIALPTLSLLGNITSNSATSLPSSSPSVQAGNEINRLFPNQSVASSSLIAIEGSNITGTLGQRAVLQTTSRIETNTSLKEVTSVSTLYSSYSDYLLGQAILTEGVLASATEGSSSLIAEVNGTANLTWGPPTIYVQDWGTARQSNPNASTPYVNYEAFLKANLTLGTIKNISVRITELKLLLIFYTAFNSTTTCTSEPLPAEFVACSDNLARKSLETIVSNNSNPLLIPALAVPVLSNLGIENFTTFAAVQNVTEVILSQQTGLEKSWMQRLWNRFSSHTENITVVGSWVDSLVNDTPVRDFPLPVPAAIWESFVDPSNSLTLIVLVYAVPDDYTTHGGAQPVFNDVGILNSIVMSVLNSNETYRSLQFWQTGEAPLDLDENTVLNTGLAFTLPLSIAALLIITGLYFRSPITPLITFGPIAMALMIAMGGTFVLGTLVTKVDVSTLTLQDVFVLGVGTDYAIFLFSRYREELVKGTPHEQAVVSTVTWAGESITISGLTVIISTLALSFSGVNLLSQWGMALSLSVLIALLSALTVVPAILTLLGPRVFWPDSGKRFAMRLEKRRERLTNGDTYFQKVGGFAVRRALPIVALALILTLPLAYVAFTAPVSYDYFGQLPASAPSLQGLTEVSQHFGPGYAFPIEILATFRSPLITVGNANVSEFGDVSNMTAIMNGTKGVASVDSPTGSTGAPTSTWLSYGSLPPVQRTELSGVLSTFVGTDGRTVLFTVIPSASGLSGNAISSLNAMETKLTNYGKTHTSVHALSYGGAASELRDLDTQTTLALDRMIAIVVVGLLLALLVLLASLAIPLMAVATISISIVWAWALTFLVMAMAFSVPIFFFDRVVLFVIVLGLGMDYNVFILTRIREEKRTAGSTRMAVERAVGFTGGIITAAAIILASVFFVLATDSFAMLRIIGFSLGVAVVLDAMVVRTFLMPAIISLLGERVWWLPSWRSRRKE